LSYIGPVSGYWSTRNTLRSQELTLTRLQDRRDQLSGQLAELKQPQILEIKAREIGMLRRGEQGYVIDFYTPKAKPAFRVEMVPPKKSRRSS
jgi:hypothetical protein